MRITCIFFSLSYINMEVKLWIMTISLVMNIINIMESKDKIKIKYIKKEKNKNEEKGKNNNKLFSVYSRRRIAFKEKEKENK